MKKISDFLSKNFLFLEMKISIYLNRRVFVMVMKRVDYKHICIILHKIVL